MPRLQGMPAFGFETKNWNAVEFYQRKKLKPESLLRSDWEQLNAAALLEAQKISKNSNKLKILSYIPLLGSFIGIWRLRRTNAPTLKANRVKHIIRGSIEVLSLGFLLIIPDLIVTLRHRKDQPEVSLEEQPSGSNSEAV